MFKKINKRGKMGVGAILVNKPARSKDKVRVNTGGGGGFMHGGGKAAL